MEVRGYQKKTHLQLCPVSSGGKKIKWRIRVHHSAALPTLVIDMCFYRINTSRLYLCLSVCISFILLCYVP